jgi:hypothetical protein
MTETEALTRTGAVTNLTNGTSARDDMRSEFVPLAVRCAGLRSISRARPKQSSTFFSAEWVAKTGCLGEYLF